MEQFKSGLTSDLTQHMSPSIPKDFPQEKIQKNICEMEFLKLNRCFLVFGAQMQCQNEYQKFLECKSERDLRLFQSIQQWEIEHFRNLTKQNQQFYLMGLDRKVSRLNDEVNRMPGSFFYQMKKKCFQSDVVQLQWRTKYLKKINEGI